MNIDRFSLELNIGDGVTFTYNGKPRFGYIEEIGTWPVTGQIRFLRLQTGEKEWRTFSVDKIQGTVKVTQVAANVRLAEQSGFGGRVFK